MIESAESELFKVIKAGDLKAFNTLFRSCYSPLCVYAADIVRNTAVAEEIVQDVLLKFWNNRDELSITLSVRAYLYKMVHNRALNHVRDRSGVRKIHEVSADDLSVRARILGLESSENILHEIINRQLEEKLAQAIGDLSPRCREIFCLARYNQLSYAEIATKLGISVSTVKSQMLRAIEKLKNLLDQHLK